MKIKDIISIIKFLKGTNGCIIMKDDLVLKTFGEYPNQIEQCRDLIMGTVFKP